MEEREQKAEGDLSARGDLPDVHLSHMEYTDLFTRLREAESRAAVAEEELQQVVNDLAKMRYSSLII